MSPQVTHQSDTSCWKMESSLFVPSKSSTANSTCNSGTLSPQIWTGGTHRFTNVILFTVIYDVYFLEIQWQQSGKIKRLNCAIWWCRWVLRTVTNLRKSSFFVYSYIIYYSLQMICVFMRILAKCVQVHNLFSSALYTSPVWKSCHKSMP